MTKKTILLFTLVLLLGGLSLYFNRSRFASEPLRISDRSLPPRGWLARIKTPANPVLFLLNRETRLTSVQVVALDALATNQYALPVWRLTSSSNSIPVQEFYYGLNIRGLKPVVKGAAAEPLQPGKKYRISIEAGSLKAEHDFIPAPRSGR